MFSIPTSPELLQWRVNLYQVSYTCKTDSGAGTVLLVLQEPYGPREGRIVKMDVPDTLTLCRGMIWPRSRFA
jgi:hypothetical protein